MHIVSFVRCATTISTTTMIFIVSISKSFINTVANIIMLIVSVIIVNSIIIVVVVNSTTNSIIIIFIITFITDVPKL